MEARLHDRGFFFPSNEIYGGPAAASSSSFDLGPNGCTLHQNLLALWRQHFILHDTMLEVKTATILPAKLIQHIADTDGCALYCRARLAADAKTLHAINSRRQNLKSGILPYNYMFTVQTGTSGEGDGGDDDDDNDNDNDHRDWLRHTTSLGVTGHFRRLLNLRSGKVPFAVAQIGTVFGKPSGAEMGGLMSMCECTAAEIQHFVNPSDKHTHVNFAEVADVPLCLMSSRNAHKPIEITAGMAVQQRILPHESIAYFMARTQLFLLMCGILKTKLLFRQVPNADHGWEAYIQTSYGWVNVGIHADYEDDDLNAHHCASGADFTAQETFDSLRSIAVPKFHVHQALVGQTFRAKSKELLAQIRNMDLKAALQLEAALASQKGGASIRLRSTGEALFVTRAMVSISEQMQMQYTRTYTPHAIQTMFVMERILYAILEHTFYRRPSQCSSSSASSSSSSSFAHQEEEEEPRLGVFALPVQLAPFQVAIFQMLPCPASEADERVLIRACAQANLRYHSESKPLMMRKRYARTDEIGTPYSITIDLQTKEDRAVTIRERDSMHCLRVPLVDAVNLVRRLVQNEITWTQLVAERDAAK